MNIASDAPKRPALRYYGGKWRLAPWIISFFPEHKNYVEPCGGAASVLLQKPRSPLETYNDLDGNVVNFFRVLRDQPDELIRKIRLTPWARDEYELSLEPCEDDVERARRFWFVSTASINDMSNRSSWRHWYSKSKAPNGIRSVMNLEVADIENTALRLIGVQIDNIDMGKCIYMYDTKNTVIYMDPPYVHSTRSAKDVYAFEWSDADHIEAATLLRNCQGFVVVSGYACPLYTELYEEHGWQRFDQEAQTNSGGKRIESVWISPRTAEALQRPEQYALFDNK